MKKMKALASLLGALYCSIMVELVLSMNNNLSPMEAFMKFIRESKKHSDEEPPDVPELLSEYDFIIVGAGSAGSVVANRLTQVSNWTVLLIEAGDKQSNILNIPGVAAVMLFSSANWKYNFEPSNVCLSMNNKQCTLDRGKVMGGSSAINFMMYNRGTKYNYNEWEAMGNPGWGWKDVLPLFKNLENMTIPEFARDTKYHSTKGELPISNVPTHTPLADAFVQAGKDLGYNEVDVNGGNPTGFSLLQSTTLDGVRWTSSKAFLHPIRNRKNLHIRKRSLVTKILIDPDTRTAYGVEYVRDNTTHMVRARKEVILSGGAINSPQLLMLSGLGPKDHLSNLGIPVIRDLKVGYNLMDHPGFPMTFLINQSVSLREQDSYFRNNAITQYFSKHEGPMSTAGGVEGYAFLDSRNPSATDANNDMEMLFFGAGLQNSLFMYRTMGYTEKFFNSYYRPIGGKHSFTVVPMVLLPKSRGRITLKTRNPFHKPRVYLDFYENPEDMETQLRGIHIAMDLAKTPAFQKYGAKLYDALVPGCEALKFATDEYWRCAAKHISVLIYHVSGTCKMGPSSDPSTVVDSRLRVHGVMNLRVIDASIMPTVPAAHTNVPSMMIAENGAKFVKEDWGVLS